MLSIRKMLFPQKLEQKAANLTEQAAVLVKKESKNIIGHKVDDTYYNNATRFVTDFSENSSLKSKSRVKCDSSGEITFREKIYRDGSKKTLSKSSEGNTHTLRTYDIDGNITAERTLRHLAVA